MFWWHTFIKFGKVLDASIPAIHGQYGFITFDCEESLEEALLLYSEDDEANEEAFYEIEGVKVRVEQAKKLNPK